MHPALWAVAILAGLWITGRTAENVGEGVNDAGSGALKLAVAGGVGAGLFWLFTGRGKR